jgi:hypothetical protein
MHGGLICMNREEYSVAFLEWCIIHLYKIKCFRARLKGTDKKVLNIYFLKDITPH